MDKIAYIAPTMEAMNIEVVEMIATSSATNTFEISDDITDADANMTNGRRGTWGDLWNKK
ncbi:MAG: hypothetical protein IJE15_07340 [Bacteroidaceae bacterium]|nr:hypothetical protein [Bacteroidaceae bacterium]